MKGELSGGCLCGAVRYRLAVGFRLNPYACHCTDCQSRTGSAFSEHMLFSLDDISIEGETDCGHYTQPSGIEASITGCPQCKARIYATNPSRPGLASLRCGTLDKSHELELAAHIWVKSKQPWISLPDGTKTMDEAPQTSQEWVELLGVVG
ncbi:GFA family protein [Erythrobacter sp. SCSIO 43205]|uniref:GFA family protein n=1 Tax=Erythrobacter sp. SCSIO 43205 TaxID=2779361 RepID=UPI001CA87F41|nr:GFA family protein [Erythrobacter sp. SCSIO 43205]UAB77363.1 GFA family protein [Erythrobacter sp. SCSIO 43205]